MDVGANAQAFALLVGAIFVFLLSTVQLALATRAVIWLVGASLLAGSGYLMLKTTGMALDHVVPAVTDAVQKADEKSWLLAVVKLNRPFVNGYIVPLLDLFLVFGVFVSLLALLSLTPGEGMEKLTRTLSWCLLGALVGGVVTLSAVAVGFGGYPQRAAYFDRLEPDKIIDGDTVKLGLAPVRLFGVDALEGDQVCNSGSVSRICGADARERLQSLTQDALVLCVREPNADGGGFRRDKYGRVLATCAIMEGSQKNTDLGESMVRTGYALDLEGRYKAAEDEAKSQSRGLWGTCTLTPEAWREDKTARRNMASSPPEWRSEDVVNPEKCPPSGAAANPPPAKTKLSQAFLPEMGVSR